MPTPGYIQPPIDTGVGKRVDSVSFGGSPELIRQVAAIGDGDLQVAIAKVTNAAPGSTDYGLTTRRAPKGLILAAINFSSNVDQPLAPATVGKINKIWKFWLTFDADTTVTLKDGNTVLYGPISYAQGGELKLGYDDEPWYITTVAQAFKINTSIAVQCAGVIGYTQE